MTDLRITFDNYVRENLPELIPARLGIACSGGVDSTVLAHLCSVFQWKITLLHINYGLRGPESEGDEAFVRSLAETLGCRVEVSRSGGKEGLETLEGSLQMQARTYRYNQFECWKEQLDLDYILTAHHLQDSLETLLLNMSRGTGLRGMAGIPARRGIYRRPLLFATRDQLLNYADQVGLKWREDSSNEEDAYLRNYIRHKVVPPLESVHPEFWQRMALTIERLRQLRDWQEAEVEKQKSGVWEGREDRWLIHLDKLKGQAHLNFLLYEWLSPFGFHHPEQVKELMEGETGKQLISNEYTLIKDRNFLVLGLRKAHEAPTENTIVFWPEEIDGIQAPLHLQKRNLDAMGVPSNRTIYLDGETLEFPLWVRKYRKDDYFQPLGMDGSKSVYKYLKDAGVPYTERSEFYVLGSGDSIVWVVGYRPDHRFRVTDQTRRIISIEWCT